MDEWQPFDPAWLVESARSEFPDDKRLHDAIATCRRISQQGGDYFVCVDFDPATANQPGSPWQWERDVGLTKTIHGLVVLVLLQDGRLGGIDFVDGAPGRCV